jgi:hypothetical protein
VREGKSINMRYNNKNQSWCLVTETYEVEVSYNYYFDSGDYYQPPEEDFEINYVKVNGVDMTDFYWDISDSNDFIYQNALEYARENRHEK